MVTLTPITYGELVHFKIAPDSEAYSACTLAQLDRIPNPTKIVNPVYPTQMARSSSGGHIHVEFYIDETGRVRMPSVSPENRPTRRSARPSPVATGGLVDSR